MKICADNATIEYLPKFFDIACARQYHHELIQQVNFSQDSIMLYGKPHLIPRMQAWFGDSAYQYSGLMMKPLAWTPTLLTIKQQVETYTGCLFNSALVNLYRDQTDSVGWHSDDEKELGKDPLIASISLGATREFKLKHMQTNEKLTLPLVEGSLLIMSGETQNYWQHAVLKSKKVIGPRINITFRQLVAPVSK